MKSGYTKKIPIFVGVAIICCLSVNNGGGKSKALSVLIILLISFILTALVEWKKQR